MQQPIKNILTISLRAKAKLFFPGTGNQHVYDLFEFWIKIRFTGFWVELGSTLIIKVFMAKRLFFGTHTTRVSNPLNKNEVLEWWVNAKFVNRRLSCCLQCPTRNYNSRVRLRKR